MGAFRTRLAFWYAALKAHVRARPATAAASGIGVLLVFVSAWVSLCMPPSTFPIGEPIRIPEGTSVIGAAQILKDAGVIRSPHAFRFAVGNRGIRAGRYVFSEPRTLRAVADALVHGKNGAASVRITFPEGVTARDMGLLLAQELVSFDRDVFMHIARPQEGYLFPDTYLFSPEDDEVTAVARLRETFDARIVSLREEIDASGRTLSDIVIMASLLEKEAKTFEEKQIIAGILWNRLAIDMPLQVDAVFGYIKDTDTFHPSFADLEIESPYNTYRNRGLPPTAIANPGLESLRAAATPVKTEYLYYLTGRDGVMRYARTFDEHRENRARYLD